MRDEDGAKARKDGGTHGEGERCKNVKSPHDRGVIIQCFLSGAIAYDHMKHMRTRNGACASRKVPCEAEQGA